MARIPGIKRFYRPLGHRRQVEEEVDAELGFHLAERAQELVGEGMSESAARDRALREFGDVERVRADCRRIAHRREGETRRVELLQSVAADLRLAARTLRRTPTFTAVAILTLALGTGATTAIFTVVSAALLRPLPFENGERVVFIAEGEKAKGGWQGSTSYLNIADWKAQSTSFEAMGVVDGWQPALTGVGEAERIEASIVSAEAFAALRIRPALGRLMQLADNLPSSENVVVVSDGFWRNRLGADRNVIGRSIRLNSELFTIIGVLPAGVRPPAEMDAELWANFAVRPQDTRDSRYLRAVARLRPAVTLPQARAELRTISDRLERAYPSENKGMHAVIIPLRDELVGDTRTPLLLLLGASAVVLLIACANLSNLLLARGLARAREFAVRTALGATGGRTVRQLLTESALLAVLGASAGLAVAIGATGVLLGIGPESLREQVIGVDWRVLGFTMALALATAAAFGLFPALRAARVDVNTVLKEGARGSSGTGLRSRRWLAVSQLALALTLLFGAAALLKSLAKLQAVEPGIEPSNLLVASLNLPARKYPAQRQPQFFEELSRQLRALPGVRDVAVTSILPFGGDWDRISLTLDGEPERDGAEKPEGDRYIVSDSYFATMGVPLKRGRLLAQTDRYDTPLVAVVDEEFERRIAPGGTAIGKRTALPGRDSLATIVGVVGHVKHYGLDAVSQGQIYMSHRQYPWRWMSIAVRTSRDPLSLAGSVREVIRRMDAEQPVFGITTMTALMGERLATRRFIFILIVSFAAIAATLAAVGLYGVIAYAVSQRERELGIRAALGASPADMLRMVVGEGVRLAGAGVVVGLVLAAAGGRLIRSLLFGVSSVDAQALLAVSTLLVLVAIGASYIPARRAARVSPTTSLRGE